MKPLELVIKAVAGWSLVVFFRWCWKGFLLVSSVWCPEWVLCDFFRREPQAAGTGGDGFAEADDRSGSLLCCLRRSPEGPPWEEGEEEAEESHRSKWTNMQLESWPPCGNPPASHWENGCFVSFPQLKPCGSPHAGWEGSMCSHFPFCWGFLELRMGWGERNHHCCECVDGSMLGFLKLTMGWGEGNHHCCECIDGCMLGFLKLRMGCVCW